MASVLQQYRQLADHMATQITGSYQSWTDFLTTAARLYKYPYHEQLMIYAQRPDATACADYELWNKRMGRYVRRGAKGIALIDHSGDAPKLKYVFDVADTRTTERSRSPYLWEYRPEHEQAVSAALEEQYNIQYPGNLVDHLEQISSVKVTEYFLTHQQDILGIVDGSYLEGYHDYDKGVAFLNAATVSTTYALLSRCGLVENAHFDPEEFMPVFDFIPPRQCTLWGVLSARLAKEGLGSCCAAAGIVEFCNVFLFFHLATSQSVPNVLPDFCPAQIQGKGELLLHHALYLVQDLQFTGWKPFFYFSFMQTACQQKKFTGIPPGKDLLELECSLLSIYCPWHAIFGQEQYAQIPMAVVGIVMKFFQIVISIVVGMAAGCIPVVGFNMGAGKRDRVRELFTKLLIAEGLVGAVALVLVEFFPRQLIGIFGAANESAYYMEFAIKAFRTYLCMMIFACVNKACFIFLQAMGKAAASTALSMIREIVFGVGFALLLPIFFGLDGVLYSMPVSDLLTFLVALVLIVGTYRELNQGGKTL